MVTALGGAAGLKVLHDHARADVAQGRKDNPRTVAGPILGLHRYGTELPRPVAAFASNRHGVFGRAMRCDQPPLDLVEPASPAQHRAFPIDDLEPHEQMGRQDASQPRRQPGIARNRHAPGPVQEPGERLVQRTVPGPRPGHELAGQAGQRHRGPAQALGQRAQECEHLVFEQSRYQPLEPAGIEIHQYVVPNRHGQPVVVLTGREPVGEWERLIVDLQRIGKFRLIGELDAGSDVLAAQFEPARLFFSEAGEPVLEGPSVHDVRRNPSVVEREHRVVAHHRPRAAELVLHGTKPRQLPGIALHEAVSALVSVLDESRSQEYLARTLPAHRREPHPTAGDERQPVRRHLLEDHGLGAPCIPMRVEVGPAHEVARRLLHPFRAHPSGHERVRPLRLHHLGGDNPWCDGRMEDRSRREPERRSSQTGVLSLRRACADTAQQTREERPVNPPGRGSERARAEVRARGRCRGSGRARPASPASGPATENAAGRTGASTRPDPLPQTGTGARD